MVPKNDILMHPEFQGELPKRGALTNVKVGDPLANLIWTGAKNDFIWPGTRLGKVTRVTEKLVEMGSIRLRKIDGLQIAPKVPWVSVWVDPSQAMLDHYRTCLLAKQEKRDAADRHAPRADRDCGLRRAGPGRIDFLRLFSNRGRVVDKVGV